MISILFPLLLLAAADPAIAPTCAAIAPPPAELAGWKETQPLAAATSAQGLSAAMLTAGKSLELALRQTNEVTYTLAPQRAPAATSHGGMVQFKVTAAGTYRIAIDSAAWIDVVAGGTGLTSVGHGHGPDCSGIRKMVDFKLAPGSYVLQIAGNATPKVHVMLVRLPG